MAKFRIDLAKQQIMDRIAQCIEAREKAALAALASEVTWYFLRQQLPPPEELEGR